VAFSPFFLSSPLLFFLSFFFFTIHTRPPARNISSFNKLIERIPSPPLEGRSPLYPRILLFFFFSFYNYYNFRARTQYYSIHVFHSHCRTLPKVTKETKIIHRGRIYSTRQGWWKRFSFPFFLFFPRLHGVVGERLSPRRRRKRRRRRALTLRCHATPTPHYVSLHYVHRILLIFSNVLREPLREPTRELVPRRGVAPLVPLLSLSRTLLERKEDARSMLREGEEGGGADRYSLLRNEIFLAIIITIKM